jgi:hypothetical protein
MDGIRVDESHLEAEEAGTRLPVDQLGAFPRELGERFTKVVHLIGDVMHARATLREKAADGCVLAERFQQLDASFSDAQRRSAHTLLVDRRLMLDLGAEEPFVGLEGGIEIVDSHSEMMNAARRHAGDATQSRRLGAV